MGGSVQRPWGSADGRTVYAGQTWAASDVPGLRMGQRVLHAKFGEGVVLQSEGSGERARIQVNFADAGAKWLMLGYANLQALD